MKVAIVGAGLAGLATALAFEQAGHEVHIFESSDDIGGRMKTIMDDSHPIDVGFHVLHTAYPTVHRWLDLAKLQPKPMAKCSLFFDKSNQTTKRLGDGLASPSHLLPTLRAIGFGDSLRLLRWRLSTRKNNLDKRRDEVQHSIHQLLSSQGFSKKTERYLRLLFTGITLDPDLSDHASFAHFTWSAMSHGSMVLLKDGIQSIPQQLRERLNHTTIHFNEPILRIEATTLFTQSQPFIADMVILATPQHISHSFVQGSPVRGSMRTTKMFCFLSNAAPYTLPALMLSSTWQKNQGSILHVNIPTLLHPRSDGKQMICATIIGEDTKHCNQHSVQSELVEWFGDEAKQWDFLRMTEVADALPSSQLEKLALNPRKDVYVVGDHCIHGSVQGTLESVERCLEAVGIPLPR
ncbi:MAG: NAD(P)/FAD-dependent oxidoreductase [Candidatus Poseidoniales archaeon]